MREVASDGHNEAIMKRLRLVPLILVLAAMPLRLFAAPVHTVSRSKFFYAQLGDILFTVASNTSDAIMPRSWDARTRLEDGDFEILANGSFGPRDFVFTGHRLRFSAGNYDLTCLTTITTTRTMHRDSTSDKVEFFDHSPTTFDSHTVQTISVGDLDCTLTTPDQRVLQGSGTYEKQSTQDRVINN
jgi:hypothetical protein